MLWLAIRITTTSHRDVSRLFFPFAFSNCICVWSLWWTGLRKVLKQSRRQCGFPRVLIDHLRDLCTATLLLSHKTRDSLVNFKYTLIALAHLQSDKTLKTILGALTRWLTLPATGKQKKATFATTRYYLVFHRNFASGIAALDCLVDKL